MINFKFLLFEVIFGHPPKMGGNLKQMKINFFVQLIARPPPLTHTLKYAIIQCKIYNFMSVPYYYYYHSL